MKAGALHSPWTPFARPLALALGGAFAAYLALRAALKLWAQRRHPGARVLPTGNPLVWVVADVRR